MKNYELTIEHLKLDKKRRIICISDIHGGYDLFINLLKKVDYSCNDYLFILGDLIEKGPDNLKVLQYIMKLKEKNDVYIIMGNNDLLAIDILFDQYLDYMNKYCERCHSLYHDMAKKLNIIINEKTDFLVLNKLIRDNFPNELRFLQNLPTIIETDNLLFAHASITDYNNMVNLNPLEVMKFDYFMRKEYYLPKRLIVGHYPSVAYAYESCSLNPITDFKKNITSIDGGYTSKIGGQLNALIFDNEENLSEHYEFIDDLPKVLALKDTIGKKATILCIWDREDFSVIEKKEKYSRCLINNKEALIPNDFVYYYNNHCYCADYTNEIISLKKGELVGLIAIYDDLAFIKKNDVLGFTPVNNIKSL